MSHTRHLPARRCHQTAGRCRLWPVVVACYREVIRLHEFNLTTIPEGLRALPQWVLWAQVAGKKVPRQARSPHRNASVTNPATWSSFDAASKSAADNGLGLGFVFTMRDPFVFVDLDWDEQPS